jgi:hypothetical protein
LFKKISFYRNEKLLVTIIKIGWLMMFNEIADLYTENRAKPINTPCEHNAVTEMLNKELHSAAKI